MAEGVRASRLATQGVGEADEVVEGVWQVKLPVPFPLGFVSVYLVEGDDGWTLVDAGYDCPPAREAWEAGACAAGCDLSRDVVRVVVTHFHADHVGAARWLQEVSAAPVSMMEAEIPFARRVWESPDAGPFVGLLVRHGMPPEMAETAAGAMRSGLRLPAEEILPLRPGEKVPMGAGWARVVHAPGHADHQLVLHDEGRRILYAADHVMLGITPNIGAWPETEPHPLARYLGSLASMRGLEADLVLPGHGPVFGDLYGRISELTKHHAGRLDAMRAEIVAPASAYEVSRRLFRGALSVHQRAFALAETLAHLDHLVLEGRVRVRDGAPVTFEAA